MARVLSAEERALWRRVTADMRGHKPSSPVAVVGAKPVVEAARTVAAAKRAAPLRSEPGTTLDGNWDRDLRTGKVAPNRVVDLHGCTLNQAHGRALSALGDAVANGERLVVVVTGKAPPPDRSRIDAPLRGIIRASFGDWLRASSLAGYIAAIRPAHARHGGAGALYVVLRRQRHR